MGNLNAYYEVSLKKARPSKRGSWNNYQTAEIDLVKREKVESLFASFLPDVVMTLAAQQTACIRAKRAKIMCKAI